MKPKNNWQKPIAAVMIVLAAAALAAAFFNLGSPAENRLLALDKQRVQALSELASCLESYQYAEQVLAKDLLTLQESGYCNYPKAEGRFTDPASGEPYKYQVLGEREYELCATFSREGEEPYYYGPQSWRHPSGEHCFKRKVSELEKPIGPVRPLPSD